MTTCGEYDLVTIHDCSGNHVVRYLKLCGGRFFGGNTWDRADGFAGGIHELRMLGGMFDLIARIANMQLDNLNLGYELSSNRHHPVPIRREMNARQIAEILGCDETDVRAHFEPLISLPDPQ